MYKVIYKFSLAHLSCRDWFLRFSVTIHFFWETVIETSHCRTKGRKTAMMLTAYFRHETPRGHVNKMKNVFHWMRSLKMSDVSVNLDMLEHSSCQYFKVPNPTKSIASFAKCYTFCLNNRGGFLHPVFNCLLLQMMNVIQ